MTISLCMIVRDEAEVLGRCLDSVAELVDEIVVVDTGSADETKAIARRYTSKVYDFPWVDDFSAARNAAFGYGTGDYLMWLDADDVLDEAARAEFQALRGRMEKERPDVVMLPYVAAVDTAGRPSFSYYRERLVRNHAGFRWEGPVHEVMVPRGRVIYGSCAVTHRKEKAGKADRNLNILQKFIQNGGELDARGRYYYARELLANGRIEEAARGFEGCLRDGKGWSENQIDACRQLFACRMAMGQGEKAVEALLKSLVYDVPRGEVCCDLGGYFLEREQIEQAEYWYRQALAAPDRRERGAFYLPAAYGYIPAIQLCVCACRRGDYRAAWEWNERAGEFQPNDGAVEHNRRFLLGKADNLPTEEGH